MKILGIETSCDETAAAIIEADKKDNKIKVVSSIVASSLNLHSQTGGIIPEVAAREQIKYILPVLEKALANNYGSIDAIAVTIGPGLIGSLVIGIETAKTFSYVLRKPLIPVNHLYGHIYANFINENSRQEIKFPAIVLIVSGGHTDLLVMKNHGSLKLIGGTRDDAAGEAFDKIGRLLGIPYPAGPKIEELAKIGDRKAYNFPSPMIYSKDFDFSFSGLKTAVLRETKKLKSIDKKTTVDICASAQKAIIDVLISKTLKAVQKYKAKSIMVSGGVAANNKLREQFSSNIKNQTLNIPIFFPDRKLCTDNAVMIAAAAFYNYKPKDWKKIAPNPELYFG